MHLSQTDGNVLKSIEHKFGVIQYFFDMEMKKLNLVPQISLSSFHIVVFSQDLLVDIKICNF